MSLELGRLSDRKPPFKYSALDRVGFSDTDAQGIVYYGRYLPYFDLARVEYHRHLGMEYVGPREREFVMRACTIEYFAPARFDDLIEMFIRVSRIGRTSVDVRVRGVPPEGRRAHGHRPPDARARRARDAHGVTGAGSFRETIRAFEGADVEESASPIRGAKVLLIANFGAASLERGTATPSG